MKRSQKKALIWIVGVILVLSGGIFMLFWGATRPAPLDNFAKCIKDSGTKLYATFWCPVCAKQKAMFGRSKRFLPYIECSTPDRKGQTENCKTAGIKAYPTWEFAGGERVTGSQELEFLAEKTSCELPK